MRDRAIARLRATPLVVRFAVLMAVTFTLFGLALTSLAHDIVADRAWSTKQRVAEVITRTAVGPSIIPATGGGDTTIIPDITMERVVDTEFVNGSLERFRLWVGNENAATSVWSHDGDSTVRTIAPDGPLAQAFRGEISSKILGDSDDVHDNGITSGRLIEVFVPVADPVNPTDTIAVATVFFPYEESSAELAADQRDLRLAILAGLIVLFLVSFPVIARASRGLQRYARRFEHEARHDSLTGLANRTLFVERIDEVIEAGDHKHHAAVLFIDIDRFKAVNDTLGHDVGDQLLIDVAERLGSVLRSTDTIARLGGDEFGLVLPGLRTREDVIALADKILGSLDSGFDLAGMTLDIGASIGVSLYPEHADDASSLLRFADIAMYEAKKDGRSFAIYAAADESNSIDGLRMLSELRAALSQGDLTLHYQPKVDLESGSTESMEALLRWEHPRHGSIGPDQFIPLAESSGLMAELTEYVLESALAQLAIWLEDGLDLGVAVNISAKNLNDVGFPDVVRSALERHDIEPRRVELELTETALMVDQTRGMSVLADLASIGVELAIDDFGTGYSSLAYLQRLPVGVIKIDRSFIARIESDPDSQTIVRSTISMAKSLGLDVVAEGVETDDVRRQLIDNGCRTAQGYFFARPMPANDVAAWMRAHAGRLTTV